MSSSSNTNTNNNVQQQSSSPRIYTLKIAVSCHKVWWYLFTIAFVTSIITLVVISINNDESIVRRHVTTKTLQQLHHRYAAADSTTKSLHEHYDASASNHGGLRSSTSTTRDNDAQGHRQLPQLNGYNDPHTTVTKSFIKSDNHDVSMNNWDNLGVPNAEVTLNREVVYRGDDSQQQQQQQMEEESMNDNNDAAWNEETGGVSQQQQQQQKSNTLTSFMSQETLNTMQPPSDLVQDIDPNDMNLLPVAAVEGDVNFDLQQQNAYQQQFQQQNEGTFQQQQQQGAVVDIPQSEVYWETALDDLQHQLQHHEGEGGAQQTLGSLPQWGNNDGSTEGVVDPLSLSKFRQASHLQGGGVDLTRQQAQPGQGLATVDSELLHHPLETMKQLKQEFMNTGGTANDEITRLKSTIEAEYVPPPKQPTSNIPIPATMSSYNIEHCLHTVNAFRYTLFFFVYDAASDSFVVIHNIPGCNFGCARIYRVASVISYGLRKNFPGRFQGSQNGSEDLVLMLSTGDAPRVKNKCLGIGDFGDTTYCGSTDFAPILQSGSVFVEPQYLPTMIALPQPVRPHLPCFDEWQLTDGMEGVCQDLQPKVDFSDNSVSSGLVFGRELGIITDMNLNLNHGNNYWDHLIPQIIWRGTDFVFLHTLYPEMRVPSFAEDIEPKARAVGGLDQFTSEYDKKRWVIQTLWRMGDTNALLPRWRGVLLTSEAELEAEQRKDSGLDERLPWINIKFANINDGGVKIPATEHEEYRILSELGISVIGDYVNMTEQAKYKYHIDLGGGGGTTWTGTVEKLALPGLLFHHMTPTKDWFHDLLVPWEHYVPIKQDLSDLRAKFDWAESHPTEAKNIAENGTRFARWMGSERGFGQLYQEYFVNPLRNTVSAYQPQLPSRYEGESTLNVIMKAGGLQLDGEFDIVTRCSGLVANSCEDPRKVRRKQ